MGTDSNLRNQDKPSVVTKHPWRTMVILLVGCFISMVVETMLNVALTTLEQDLGVSTSMIQWVTTGYILVVAIIIPITAFLIHCFTTKQLFSGAMSILLAGLVIAGFSNSFAGLMIARIIQASGAGMMVSIIVNTGLTIMPPSKHGFINAICAGTATLGPAFGPIYAGVMLQILPWQGLFWILVPIVVILIICSFFFVENASDLSKPHIDILSVFESSVAFVALIYGITCLGENMIKSLMCIAVGILVLLIFKKRQEILEKPFLNVRLLNVKGFPLVLILLFCTNFGQLTANVLFPMLLQQGYDYSVLMSSIALLPGVILLSIGAPVSGRIFDKHGAKGVCTFGVVCITGAMLLMALTRSALPMMFYIGVCMLMYLGIGFSQAPLQSHIYEQLTDADRTDAVAMSNVGLQIGGSTGSAVSVILYSQFRNIFAASADGIFHSFSMTFLVLGVVFVIPVILVIWLFKREK